MNYKPNAIVELSGWVSSMLQDQNIQYQLEQDYEKNLTITAQYIENVKQELFTNSVHLKKEKQVTRYIHLVQSDIIDLCNLVFLQIRDHWKIDLKDSYQERNILYFEQLLTIINGLLLFIQNRFPQHFNQDDYVPNHQLFICREKLQTEISATIPKSKCSLNSLVLEQISNMIIRGKTCNFHRFKYLQEILLEVKKLCPKCKSVSFNCSLNNTLVCRNFNTNAFFTHQVENIGSLMEKQDGHIQRISFLNYQLKLVNQLHVIPGISFFKKNIPVKEQINGFIEEEIKYQNQKRILDVSPPQKSTQLVKENQLKLAIDLTADEFGGIIHMASKQKVLKSSILETVMFAEKYFILKDEKTYKAGSLKNACYKISEATKEKIRSMLLKLFHMMSS
jgi:hypothetical protein